MRTPEIEQRASFDFVRYANCWEDAELLLGAASLDGARCLSICSAGDNSLSLLAANPSEVVAFDLNPAQIALGELKRAAMRALGYEEFLAFLGFRESDCREATYRARIAPLIPVAAQEYFEAHLADVRDGVIHRGKFESYFHIFSRRVLPLVHSRRTVRRLLQDKTPEERRSFYHGTWNNFRFKTALRLFFSRTVMGRLGRDPEFFRHVAPGSIRHALAGRTAYALTELPTHDNPYLHYILAGTFGDALPYFARRENFDAIRANLGSIRFVLGKLSDLVADARPPFDFMNLSDIFEYMDEALFAETARTIHDCAATGTRVAYYNMLVPRLLPRALPGGFKRLDTLSDNLFAQNRAFFYGSLHVDEVQSLDGREVHP